MPYYTTVSYVRELSGLQNSTNIPDTRINGKIMIASAMIDGALRYKYSLPVTFHRSNTLAFSGTGSGSGTMTITVNGEDYDIAISSGLTATQAADLFREAAKDNSDFVTDGVGGGTTAVLISQTSSTDETTANAEVNITAAATTQGISATIGTRTDRYPQLLNQLCAEIATALLFIDEYGVEATGTPRDGVPRLEQAQKMLKQITGEEKPMIPILDEVSGEEFSRDSLNDPAFIPSSTTNDDSSNSTAYKVSMNTKL